MSGESSSAFGIDDDHWLRPPVRRLVSPHCDERPLNEQPSLIVLHNISLPPGEFGGPWIDDLFMGRLDATLHPYFESISTLRVSAHVCVRRDGGVTQYVPFNLRAWHAGVSTWRGRDRCNDYSIGIELEGTDHRVFEEIQYLVLRQVIVALKTKYPRIGPHGLVGHSSIAPSRKTDPGPFIDWGRVEAMVR